MSVQERPSVYFTDRGDASFILGDAAMLSAFTTVRRYSFRAGKWTLFWELFRALFRSIREISRSDLVVCQFGGWNSWVPLLTARLFRKPSVLVVHGTDCVSLPSIGYGNFRKWPLNAITRSCFRSATRILPVHESLVLSCTDYATGSMTEQGIRVHCPGLGTPITVLHHGFDAARWTSEEGIERSGILTVATGLGSASTRALKGVDLIIACAKAFPELRFTVVGLDRSHVEDLPENVAAVRVMPQEELLQLYRQARFYLQLSMSEGFGCALAEAMLCGCVPVVSNAGSLPDIIGDTGYVLMRRDANDLADLLRGALDRPAGSMSARARARIVERFPLVGRAEGWRRVVEDLLDGPRLTRTNA